MGMTVNFGITYKGDDIEGTVAAMRKLATGFPFDKVGRMRHITQQQIEKAQNSKDEDARWLASAFGANIRCPWGKKDRGHYINFNPVEAYQVNIEVGDGSEWLTLGLARYPETIEIKYEPTDDGRYIRTVRNGGSTHWEVDYDKLRRARWKGTLRHQPYSMVTVTTGMKGWSHSSFCKTIYANNPACGGLANFLKCHVSVVTLLERIGKLPGVRVRIDDEGHYGTATYSDDYREAYAAGREPTYVFHKATHDVGLLAKEAGEDLSRLAAFAGAFSEMAGDGQVVEAPIKSFANFEHLEFKGHQDKEIAPFLEAMAKIAAERRVAAGASR
jgi:hypothetical protein